MNPEIEKFICNTENFIRKTLEHTPKVQPLPEWAQERPDMMNTETPPGYTLVYVPLPVGDNEVHLVLQRPKTETKAALTHADKVRIWFVVEKILTDWIPGLVGSRLLEKVQSEILNELS